MNTNQKINRVRAKNSAGIKRVADACHKYLFSHLQSVVCNKGLVKQGSIASIHATEDNIVIRHNIEALEVRVPINLADNESVSKAIKSVTHLEYRIASK